MHHNAVEGCAVVTTAIARPTPLVNIVLVLCEADLVDGMPQAEEGDDDDDAAPMMCDSSDDEGVVPADEPERGTMRQADEDESEDRGYNDYRARFATRRRQQETATN